MTEKRDKPEKRPRKNAATLLVEIAAELYTSARLPEAMRPATLTSSRMLQSVTARPGMAGEGHGARPAGS